MPDPPPNLAPAVAAAPLPSPLLQSKLDALRRKRLSVALGTGLAQWIGAAVLLLAAAMLVDFWLDLPWGLRAGLLIAICASLGLLTFARVARPFLRQPDDDDLALSVEQARPVFRTRLIASLQLTRPGAVPVGAAPSLVRALVRETETLARAMDFAAIVPTRELKKFGAWAGLILLAGVIGFFAGGANARVLLRRVFLSHEPVPRKTRVFVVNGDKVIGRGDGVVIEAVAQGVIPASGRLVIKQFARRGQAFIMERASNAPNRFVRSIENVQESFNYTVHLNDGASSHTVKVLPRPALTRIQCEQVFPAYTKRPPVKRPLGDLTLLAGSTLRLSATASKPLRHATLKLEGLDQTVPLAINPGNPKELTGQIRIPATNLTGFSVQLLDTDGMDPRDPAVYPIEIVPDKAPTVRITTPERKEELVTQTATLPVGFLAQDDFQVAHARLHYKIGEADDAPVKQIELDLTGGEAPQVLRLFEWKIADAIPNLPLGTRIEFWMEVEDNNDVTGPGRTSSDHQLARVVTADEKRADLLNRAGDYLGTISDVTGDQERLNQNLGALILEKKP